MMISLEDCLEKKRIFRNSMILREDADYRRKFSQEVSQAVIESAKRFLKATKEILPKEEGT
ncbi:MAG: hypothetical protein L6416_01925 [Candidatus Omnitrophica bacterium]|nr:hypothetical protein [Candidatus Omnitrophota bacterium]